MTEITAVATGMWDVAGTWNPAQIPVSGDTVSVDTFTVTVSSGLTIAFLDLQIPASGTLIVQAGGELIVDDALSATINVAAGGALQASGTAALPVSIHSVNATPTNHIQFSCDGAVDLEYTTFTAFETVSWNGTGTFIDSDLSVQLTGTTQIAFNLTGTIILTRSSFRSDDTSKTWYFNFATGSKLTMDKGSDLGTAYLPRIQGTSTNVLFLDAPLGIHEVYKPRLVIHDDLLGATTARARKMGMGGRMIELECSFQSGNLDQWSYLNDLNESMTDTTLTFTWDEGVLMQCNLIDIDRARKAGMMGEIFFTVRLIEITTA